MARQTKSELNLTEAADKTAALLQGLQSRLNRNAGPGAAVPTGEETSEELDRQLQEYFVAESGKPDMGTLDQIRDRVIDAVADRILERWESGDRRELGALQNQVVDRVAERILERMARR